MDKADSRARWGILGLLAVVGVGAGVGVYLTGVTIPYYADDFNVFYLLEGRTPLSFFTMPNTALGFYRPAQDAFLLWVQMHAGLSTWPIHLMNLSLHLGLCALVFAGARRLGLTCLGAGVAAVFMLVSQANVHAVLSTDTLSQVGAAFFGYLGLLALLQGMAADRRWWLAGSVAAFAVGLLFKESGAAFFVMMLVVLGLGVGAGKMPVRRALAMAAVLVAVLAVYLVVRGMVAPVQPALGAEGPYGFAFGANIVRNAALFAAAGGTVVSSVSVFGWVWAGHVAAVVGAGLLALGFWAMVGLGVVRAGRGRLAVVLVGLAALSLVPAYFLNRVSELYLYNAMPLLSLVVGVGAGFLWANTTGGRRVAVGVVVVGVMALHLGAVWQKATAMRENGRRAATLVEQAVDYVREHPSMTTLLITDPPTSSDPPAYSVFGMPGAAVLWASEPVIRWQSGRPALGVIVPARPADLAAADAGTHVLTLCDGGFRLCPVTP